MPVSDVEHAELLQRLADLEAAIRHNKERGGVPLPQAVGGDSYNSNVFKVAADGSVTADFDGHVHAGKGFDLDESVVGPPVSDFNKIRWLRPGAVTPPEQLYGYTTNGANATLQVSASSSAAAEAASIFLSADNNASRFASLSVSSVSGAGGTQVGVSAAGINKLLLDETGASSFLQLLTNSKRVVNYGQANLTFAAAAVANTANIAHGLGVTPSVVVCSGLWKAGAADAYVVIDPSASTSTNFSATARATVALTGTWPFYWLAIG